MKMKATPELIKQVAMELQIEDEDVSIAELLKEKNELDRENDNESGESPGA